MSRTEEFYRCILKKKVVNTDELKDISNRIFKSDKEYYYRKYLHKLINEGKIGKIRRGIYYGIPLDRLGEGFQVDRYLVGAKIQMGEAFGYHTALEMHGAAHSSFNTIFLLTCENRFRSFRFQGVSYVPVLNRKNIGNIMSVGYKEIDMKVTDPHRTFVDCLDRVDLCGGWEECLKSLADLKGISVSNIKDVLVKYDNKTLELKCGYVLELLSAYSPYYGHINNEQLEPIGPPKEWVPVYMDRNVPGKLNKRWGLYVPDGLHELLRGV